MKTNLVMCLAALVLIGLGGLLINRYGQARYDQGVSDTTAAQVAAADKANMEERKNLEDIKYETDNLDDASVDNALRSIGIVRRPEDR